MFPRCVAFFWQSEEGQDLSEYCLLTALIALVACAIFVYASGGIQNLWTAAGSTLSSAPGASSANGSQPSR